jgi:2-methylcitrate dehydratase PrpD
MALRQQYHIQPQDIADIVVEAPPLVKNLVGRALQTHTPSPQFARLCLPLVLAHVFLKGDVFINDFEGEALTDPQVHALAQHIRVVRNAAVHDENAMVPLVLHVHLRNGQQYTMGLEAVLGSPVKPLSQEAQLQKFHRCWQYGGQRLPAGNAERLIALVQHLEEVDDATELCRLVVP